MLTDFHNAYLEAPFELVNSVDLEKYAGRWFVISHLPFASEPKNNEREIYTLRSDGKIDIEFEYSKDELGHEKKVQKQIMWPLNKNNNMMRHRIHDSTFDYGIIDIDENYQWVVVGTLDQKHCWIMSRQHEIDPQVKERVLDKLNILGFETSKMEDVFQKPDLEKQNEIKE